jgi:excisionase family DNA binding protein
MTPEDLEDVRRVVTEAVDAAFAKHLPRQSHPRQKKSRAGYLTLAEAEALIRTPVSTLRFWIWQGKLTACKPGRVVLVRESELLAHVEKNESTAKRAARVRAKRRIGGALLTRRL